MSNYTTQLDLSVEDLGLLRVALSMLLSNEPIKATMVDQLRERATYLKLEVCEAEEKLWRA